ncbi:MAG: hypothetical protein ACKPGI_17520, partial [Verrucomicrobiota bacterium]
ELKTGGASTGTAPVGFSSALRNRVASRWPPTPGVLGSLTPEPPAATIRRSNGVHASLCGRSRAQ